MFSIIFALAHPIVLGTPAMSHHEHDVARFRNDCFAFAVSYSARGRKGRHRPAVVTNVIRYTAPRAGRCYREESAIRAQFDRALATPGTRYASVDYTTPVVYTYSKARTAYRRRAEVIDKIDRRWRVVEFRFRYLPRISPTDRRRRWRNGRPGLEWITPGVPLPGRVNPRAPVRIVRRPRGS